MEIFETMTRKSLGIYTVRVWRSMPFFCFGDSEMFEFLQNLTSHEPSAIFKKVREFDKVSAVEITNAAGQGLVWYKDWP